MRSGALHLEAGQRNYSDGAQGRKDAGADTGEKDGEILLAELRTGGFHAFSHESSFL